MKKLHHTQNLTRMTRAVRWACVALCLLLAVGCGDNNELKIDQAKIALANNKPDRAISLVDSVLASDPGNFQAMLIQARAQIALDRLGPAKLTLQRLAKQQPDNPQVARALLDWSIHTIDKSLANAAFATSELDRQAYDEARALALRQLEVLRGQSSGGDAVAYNEALLNRGALNHARTLIKHTQRKIEQLGADAVVRPDSLGGADSPDDTEAELTYGQQLEHLKQAEAEALGALLAGLETMLESHPGHVQAASLYLRTTALEQQWDRLLAQAKRFTEASPLPVETAQRTITMLLGVPESVSPLADRIELGQALLRATPADQSESEGRLVSSARLLYAEGQTDKALPILAKVIEEQESTDPSTYLLYAQVLFDSGDDAKCREVLERMLPEMESNSIVQTLYGLTLWRLGEVSDARAALRQASRLDPTNKRAAEAFASLIAQQGMLGASGEDIQAFYELDPTNPRAIQFKLQHAAATGDPRQIAAMTDALEAKAQHTPNELSLLYQANTLLRRHNTAERWARAMIDREPDNQDWWMNLAATQMRQGDEAAMRETLGQVAGKFPDAPGAPGAPGVEQLTGELYIQTQQYERAVAVLGAVVEADESNTGARMALARAMAAMGRFNSALEQVKQLAEASPDNLEALALGARIAIAADQRDLADDYLSRIDPTEVDADKDAVLAAQVYLSRGKLDEAEAVCTRAIASGQPSPMLRLVLAEVYQEKDEPDRAEEHLVALVRHFPNNAEVYTWLGQFYARLGKTDEGIEVLKSVEVYNRTLALTAQASLLRAGGKLDDAVALLDPLLDRLIAQRDAMAPTVADAIAKLHQQRGDTPAADAVYERLYASRDTGISGALAELIASWDSDSPARRLTKLDAAAARVDAQDTAAINELSRRYAMLGRSEQALSVVQRGLGAQPEDPTLLGVKAGVLAVMGRTGDAVQAYEQLLRLSPGDQSVRIRYARALAADTRRPEAEQELIRLTRQEGPAALSARAALLQVYLELGLYERAVSTVDAVLDRLPMGQDAELDLVIGRVLAQRKRYVEAQQRLDAVAADSPYYPTAQVTLARSQAESGDIPSAQSRITRLVQDPAVSRRAIATLLSLDPLTANDRSLLSTADKLIDARALPFDLAQRWLAMRLKLSDLRGDWDTARETLGLVAQLNDGDDSMTALRIALLFQQKQAGQAKELLRLAPRLEGAATGSLLAFALDVQAPSAGRRHPMADILISLSAGDREALSSAVTGYSGVRTVFGDDLLASCRESGAVPAEVKSAYRDLAMALVALEGRMPGLAEVLCESAIDKAPDDLPAFALRVAAGIEQGQTAPDYLDRARALAPEGSLPMMLDVMVKVSAGDHSGAADGLSILAQRHPDNPHAVYQHAQELSAAGRMDEAAQAFAAIAEGTGPYRLAAMNDLAYLRAQQGEAHLDEAIGLARDVLRALPTSPAVMDTAGWIEHLRGRHDQALTLLTRSIVSLTDVPEAHYHIGAAYHAAGVDQWARYHLQQAAAGEAGTRGVEEAKQLLDDIDSAVALP